MVFGQKKKKQNGKIESKHMYSVLKLDKSKKSLTEMRVSGGVCYVLLGLTERLGGGGYMPYCTCCTYRTQYSK